jgi:hypothetical protein
LALCDEASDFCSFEFLSIEHETIRSRAEQRRFISKAKFGVVDEAGLPERYLSSDFGFVLRDDTAVNRVSCPTKLSEYLWFGVIPIVKTPHVGDFLTEGFSYVTEGEFAAGLLPDEPSCERMRRNNRDVLGRLIARYEKAAEFLRDLTLPNRIGENSLAGLPIGNRHLTFPNHAELYVFATGMHHFVRDVIDSYTEMQWQPDVPDPARAIRLIPVLADATVSLRAVTLTVKVAASEALKVTCVTPGKQTRGGIQMSRAAPFFDLHFSAPLVIEGVRTQWGFIDAGGANGNGLASEEAHKLDVHVVLNDGNVKTFSAVPIGFET